MGWSCGRAPPGLSPSFCAHWGMRPAPGAAAPSRLRRRTPLLLPHAARLVIAELRPTRNDIPELLASSGRIVGEADVVAGDTVLALLETPAALSPNVASVMVAASTATPGWRSRAIEISIGGQSSVARTAARK